MNIVDVEAAIEIVRQETELEMRFWKGEVGEGRVLEAHDRAERFFYRRPETLRAVAMVSAAARKPVEALSRDDLSRYGS